MAIKSFALLEAQPPDTAGSSVYDLQTISRYRKKHYQVSLNSQLSSQQFRIKVYSITVMMIISLEHEFVHPALIKPRRNYAREEIRRF